jgi:hypothetical protein
VRDVNLDGTTTQEEGLGNLPVRLARGKLVKVVNVGGQCGALEFLAPVGQAR